MTFIPDDVPFFQKVAEGEKPGYTCMKKYGRNSTVNIAYAPIPIWSPGADNIQWNPPDTVQDITIKSSSIEDAGNELTSGTATGGSSVTLGDSGATFLSDGISVGDAVLNDTTSEFGYVVSVDDNNTITFTNGNGGAAFTNGDSYRVVTMAASRTGVGVIKIERGFDANFNVQEEFVIMNGTTKVNTALQHLRINRMRNILSGSTRRNQGNVDAEIDDSSANLISRIEEKTGQTQMAMLTVEAGKECYINAYDADLNKGGNPSGAMADITIYTRLACVVNSPETEKLHLGLSVVGSSTKVKYYSPSRYIPPCTDIVPIVASVTDNGMDVDFTLDVIFKDIT